MNNLKAGFARLNINPMLGIGLSGYFKIRKSDGILDDLEAVALALEAGDKRIPLTCRRPGGSTSCTWPARMTRSPLRE